MSNNIDNKIYILHYKVYKGNILYFKNDYSEESKNSDLFYSDHNIEGTVNVVNDEIYIADNSSITVMDKKDIPAVIRRADDFTIYFRLRLSRPNKNNVYHILSDGLTLAPKYQANGNRYSFQIKIDKNYKLVLSKGIPGYVTADKIKELINVDVSALSNVQQHYIAISRYKGRLRAYLDGKKIFDDFAITEKKNKDEFFIPPEYIGEIAIGSANTSAFFINDLVVCQNFAFYRNLDFNIIPDDIVQPKNTYFKYAVSEEKKFNTSRDIKKTFDEEHENAFKFKTSREVWGSIYNTRRDIKKTFDEEHGNAFKFNTLLLPARFEGLDSHNTERDVRYTFDEEHNNAFKFNTSVTNTISLDKIKDADKYIKKKTERNVMMNLWTMIGDIRFDGIKFNTKLIITNTIDVEIFFNSMRRCIINIEKMFNTKKEVKQIGDANHPSQVNNTIRDVRATYYLKFNTNLMALIIQNNNTKRNVVLTVTKTYETRRHVKVYTRPYIVFVTNTNINIEQPKDYEYINELLKN